MEKRIVTKLQQIENIIRNTTSGDDTMPTLEGNKSDDTANTNINDNHDIVVHSVPDRLSPLKSRKNDVHVSVLTKRTIRFEKSQSEDIGTNEIRSFQNRFRRQEEIIKYNDTIQVLNQRKIYFYYWEIHNVADILQMQNTYVQSPYFSAFG